MEGQTDGIPFHSPGQAAGVQDHHGLRVGRDGFNGGKNQNDLLDAALAAGINTLDTARVYAQSERVIGQWLGKHRDEVVLITKCAHPSLLHPMRLTERDIRKDCETSLRELGTDRIDIYLLHRSRS